jgi:Leucine-rich repeat (LRR) protein
MERERLTSSLTPSDETQPLLRAGRAGTHVHEEDDEGGIGLRDLSQISPNPAAGSIGSEAAAFTTLPVVLVPVSGSIQSDLAGDSSDRKALGDYQLLVDGNDYTKLYEFLASLGIAPQDLEKAQIPRDALFRLYQKEFSRTSWWKWSSLDHAVEKHLQWPLLSPTDIGDSAQKAYHRIKPEERSILLKTSGGLMKAYAMRGFVQGVETGLLKSLHYFIYAMLAYRFEELLQTGHSNFDEFQAIFSGSNQKGVDSLVRSLAHLDAKWLRLILAAPVILGVLQGLWSMRSARWVSPEERQATLDKITQSLRQAPSICRDVIHEEMPLVSNCVALSSSVQKLEQWVRWDGRLDSVNRKQVFELIRQAARDSRKISQLNILESLAKIAHGIGLKDFPRLKSVGYSSTELTDLLYIKATALSDLEMLSRQVLQEADQSTLKKWLASLALLPRRLYASYLLWWVGQSTSFWRQQLPFTLFKIIKLGLEGLLLQVIVASILEAIRCPDKPGFSFGNGYADWASDYTAECFTTRISLFQTIDINESVADLVAEIPQYHLTELTTLDLSSKYLISEEALQIIQAVVRQGAPLQALDLAGNQISALSEDMFNGLNQLTELYLSWNQLSVLNNSVFNGLSQLKKLDLHNNYLTTLNNGIFNGLDQLTELDLGANQLTILNNGIFSELSQLTYLSLWGNKLTALNNGIFSKLSQLTELDLGANQLTILNNGIFSELSQLTYLSLESNKLTALSNGVFSKLSQLTELDLGVNQLTILNNGVFSELSQLTDLDLGSNQLTILENGIFSRLNQLQSLSLWYNYLNTSVIMNVLVSIPVTLTHLDISSNQMNALPQNFSILLPIGVTSLLIGNNSFIPNILTREFMQYFPYRLTSFSIESSHIINITKDCFADFFALTQLDLSVNQLSMLNNATFSGLSQLKYLDLDFNQLSVLDNGVFSELSQLTYLSLWDNKLTVLNNGIFSGLNQLTYLSLATNQLTMLNNSIFSRINQLTALLLGGNQLTILENGVFSELNQLIYLDLSGNRLTVLNNGVFSGLSQLTYLYLFANFYLTVLNDGVFSELNQLTYLDLSLNQLNDTAILNMTVNFPYQLNYLNLDFNLIGNNGMQLLAEILPCTNITYIDLTDNPANDTSVALAAQQNALKKVCDDQLCHANLPASESCSVATGSTTTAQVTWGSGSSIELMDEAESNSPAEFSWPHSGETPSFQDALFLPSATHTQPTTPLFTPVETGAIILGVVSVGILLYKRIHAVVNASNRLFQRCWNGERRGETRTASLAQSSNRRYDLFTSSSSPTPRALTPAKITYSTPR